MSEDAAPFDIGWDESDANEIAPRVIVTMERYESLLAAQSVVEDLEGALRECITTAAELRRNISPDKGCGYGTYKTVWDASFAAERRAKSALRSLPSPEPTQREDG